MTLIVVSVVVSIGLTLLDLSLKQIRLSTNSKDSEVAFHAANAGMECARYWRRIASSTMEAGGVISPSCFSGTVSGYTDDHITSGVTGNADVYLYNYSITWDNSTRCSQVTTLIASSTTNTTISNMRTHVPGYPESNNQKTCSAGETCTVLSVRGYNQPCGSGGAAPTSYGVVQREVLLQF